MIVSRHWVTRQLNLFVEAVSADADFIRVEA